ncbi:MAG: hypothetical protein ABSG38_16445 [Spirochaetia bacterium]|jgi:hypothetical protein
MSDERESALYGFRVFYSGMLRAIATGRLTAVPCLAPNENIASVDVGKTHYVLEEVEPAALRAVLDAEPQAMAKTVDAAELCKQLLADNRRLLREVSMLRAALHPFEEVTMRALHDSETGELIGSQTIKRLQ